MFDNVQSLMKQVLKLGGLLVLGIALLGSLVGYLVADMPGVWAALAGSSAAFVFMALTVLSIYFGSRFSVGILMGLVLGGWLVKMVLFMILFTYLNQADWLTQAARPIVFFTVVLAVVLGLILDVWIVSKARLSPETKLP